MDQVEGSPLAVGIYAGPGFGKTHLAWEYFRHYGPKHYPGGRFWVNAAQGEDGLKSQFYTILRKVQPLEKVANLKAFRESRLDAAQELREALTRIATETRLRILFVVDDIPEPAPGEQPKPLHTWCPARGMVSLLVTSRARQYLQGDDFRVLDLGKLPPEVSVELLKTGGNGAPGLSDEEWRTIAERVGHLPLALNVLRSCLLAKLITPRKLLSEMNKKQGAVRTLTRLDQELARQVAVAVPGGVEKAFALSYARLSRPARRAVRLVAQLAPEPVPMKLLEALVPGLPSDLVRMELSGHNWVTAVNAGYGEILLGSMHLLMADFVRGLSWLPAVEQRSAVRSLVTLLSGIQRTRTAPEGATTVTSGMADEEALLEACLPHAEHILDQVLKQDSMAWLEKLWSMLGGTQRHAAELIQLGEVMLAAALERGSLRLAERVGNMFLQGSGGWLAPEAPEMLRFREDLAKVLRRLGELREASRLQEEALEVRLRTNDEKAREVLIAKMDLAVTHLRMGRVSRALDWLELVHEEVRQGADHLLHVTVTSHLAEALRQSGELLQARELQQQVLTTLPEALEFERAYQAKLPEASRRNWIRERLDELPSVTSAKSSLARTLKELGPVYLKAAFELERDVLRQRCREFGRRHPDTLAALASLAETLRLQKRLNRARRSMETVWKCRRRALGEEHPDTLAVLGQLAGVLYALGETACPKEMLEQVLRGQTRVWGEEHPETLATVDRLANLLQAVGESAQGLVLKRRALAIRSRVFEEMDRRRLKAILVLTVELRKEGKAEQAQERQERLLRRMIRELGGEHPDTIEVKSELAKTFRERSRLVEALQHQKDVLALRRRDLPPDDPLTIDAMEEVARTHIKRGEYWYARRLEEEVLEARRRVLGPTDEKTLEAACQLARTCHALGAWEDVLRLWLEIWELRQPLGAGHALLREAAGEIVTTLDAIANRGRELARRVRLSDDITPVFTLIGRESLNPNALKVLDDVAYSQDEIGRMCELLETALRTSARFLDREHVIVVRVLNSLVPLLRKQGQHDKARELAIQALKICQETLGDDEEETLTAMHNAASLAAYDGNNDGAKELFSKLIDGRRRVSGDANESLETLLAQSDGFAFMAGWGWQKSAADCYAKLRAVFQRHVESCPGGERIEHPVVSLLSGNVAWPLLNAAFLPTTELDSVELLETAVSTASDYYAARQRAWAFVIADDVMTKRIASELPERMARQGLVPWKMKILELLKVMPPDGTLPALEIKEVAGALERGHLIDVATLALGKPRDWVREVLDSEALFREKVRAYVGYREGQPTTCVMVMAVEDVVYVSIVATVPEYRRQRHAESVIRYALGEAQRNWGLEKSLIHTPRDLSYFAQRVGYHVRHMVTFYSKNVSAVWIAGESALAEHDSSGAA